MTRFKQMILSGVLVVATAGGCSAYHSRYTFEPAPVDVAAQLAAVDGEPVRTLVSVVGVRLPDEASALPLSIEVRFRVENTSSGPVTFEPDSLVLHSAGLERFGAPIVRTDDPLVVAPGGSSVVEAFFPLPDDQGLADVDLNGLNVRWTLSIDGHPVTGSATFRRRPDAYYDRYHLRIGVGYHAYPG